MKRQPLQGLSFFILTFDFCKDVHISGTERIIICLARMDPADIVMLQRLGLPRRNGAVEKRQTDQHIGIVVQNFHKSFAHFYRNGQLFRTFPDQSLFQGFSRLCFAAYKFPETVPSSCSHQVKK